MGAKKSFQFGEWSFSTQKELDITIKHIFSECPRNAQFTNSFLSKLINKYHLGVNHYNLECVKLKILTYSNQIGIWEFAQKRFRGGEYVIGYFKPVEKWHGVTIYPHKKGTIKQNLIRVLRQKLSESIERRDIKARCEECGGVNPQLHHDNVSFKTISNECLKFFSDKELLYGVGDDWWEHENDADAIPDSHRSVVELLNRHKEVKYRWLCIDCHKAVHRGAKI